MESTEYPALLRKLKDPPKQLYIKGNYCPEIFEKCLAVVGSRKMTDYGKQVTQFLIPQIVGWGITVVSGFMYGIDAEAHRSALSVGGKTIAVMPCGIDLVCPDFQQELYDSILDNDGLIISEYPGDVEPKMWTFPRRNRIVAGLSQATLVIEAGEKSGSLITADIAKKLGRAVFTVPGSIINPSLKGNWQLITDGATETLSGCEIRHFYFNKLECHELADELYSAKDTTVRSKDNKSPPLIGNLTSDEKNIMDILSQNTFSLEEILTMTNLDISKLSGLLTSLTIKGFVKQEGLNYYAC